jgi:CRP-like cAMP-binding protein
MKHILISGDWQLCMDLIGLIHQAGDLVSLAPRSNFPAADLLVARLTEPDDISTISQGGLPWIAWSCANEDDLATQCYQAGAQAVFPGATPAAVIFGFMQRFLEKQREETAEPLEKAIQRNYQKGDTILLGADSVLEVQEGIIAQTMVHQDGAEVLLGLFGPHHLVVPHPEDTCYIQLIAHTNAKIMIQPWPSAVLEPGFADQLRSRLQQMEAWAAMQARPHLDQRVLGILSLLAEQFGVAGADGEIITVRITHMQLASAVGATRTTITRTLGELKNQGRLAMLQTADGERFCLPAWEPGHHG